MTAPTFIEHVLVPAPMERIRPGSMSCAGCCYAGPFGCEYDLAAPIESSLDPMCAPAMVYAVVPAGFSDAEVPSHE